MFYDLGIQFYMTVFFVMQSPTARPASMDFVRVSPVDSTNNIVAYYAVSAHDKSSLSILPLLRGSPHPAPPGQNKKSLK